MTTGNCDACGREAELVWMDGRGNLCSRHHGVAKAKKEDDVQDKVEREQKDAEHKEMEREEKERIQEETGGMHP